MPKRTPEPTTTPRERAFLVGVELYQEKNLLTSTIPLAELALLADTAGLDVVGEMTQKLDRPNPETYIGSGKVEELKAAGRRNPGAGHPFRQRTQPAPPAQPGKNHGQPTCAFWIAPP
jgi:hypothetical protein